MEPPKDYARKWNIYEDIADWTPYMLTNHRGEVFLSLCWYRISVPIQPSDGCDVILRSQHCFRRAKTIFQAYAQLLSSMSTDRAGTEADNPYSAHRQCCLSREYSIEVAVEKDWYTLQREYAEYSSAIVKRYGRNLRKEPVNSCISIPDDDVVYGRESEPICGRERALRLLRSAFCGKDQDLLGDVFVDDAVYYSDQSRKTLHGKDNIVDYLRSVSECQNACYSYLATIVSANERTGIGRNLPPAVPAGTRVIILAYDDPKELASVVVVDTNDTGCISRIHISDDCRYRFKIDGVEYRT